MRLVIKRRKGSLYLIEIQSSRGCSRYEEEEDGGGVVIDLLF